MGKAKENTQKAPRTAAEKFDLFWLIWNLAEAFILLGAGIASIIGGILYKEGSKADVIVMQNVLPFVVGAFVIMDGVLRTIMTLLKKKKTGDTNVILVAGFELTAGIVLMLVHETFTNILIYFVSVLLIVVGTLMTLTSAFAIKRHASKLYLPIMEIFFSAVLIAVGVGIIVMYLQPESNNQVVLIIAGTVMTIASIALAISAASSYRKRAKERNAVVVVDSPEAKNKTHDKMEKTGDKQKEPVVIEMNAEEPEPKQIESN